MAKRDHLFIVSAFVLIAIFSFIRPMNYDEAYYIESSHLLISGNLPYSNFHFHMMPLLLLLYAPFSSFGFWSYVILKIVSVAFILFTFLIYRSFLLKKGFDSKNVMYFSALFFFNSFFLDWALAIKIYSVSIFLFAGYIFYFDKYISGNYQNKNLYISALFMLLLLFLKLSFAGNVALFFGFAVYALKKNKAGKNVNLFLTCCLIFIIPLILLIFLYRSNYDKLYFDLVESNLIMRKYYYPFDFSKIYLPLLVPQNLILIFIIVLSGLKYSMVEKFIFFNIFIFILVHSFTSMLPEYYSTIIPLVILLSVFRFERFLSIVKSKIPNLSASGIIYAVSIVYILSIPFGISSLIHIFDNKPLVLNTFEMITLRETINSTPGKTILSSWVGYSIYSNKEPLMADQYVSSFLREYMSQDEVKHHNVSTYNDFRILILEDKPDIIVYDSVNPSHLKGLQYLIKNRYSVQAEYKNVIVYRKF